MQAKQADKLKPPGEKCQVNVGALAWRGTARPASQCFRMSPLWRHDKHTQTHTQRHAYTNWAQREKKTGSVLLCRVGREKCSDKTSLTSFIRSDLNVTLHEWKWRTFWGFRCFKSCLWILLHFYSPDLDLKTDILLTRQKKDYIEWSTTVNPKLSSFWSTK